MLGTNLSVDYLVTRDEYYSATLSFTGSPALSPVTINFGLSRFADNKFDSILAPTCGCGNKSTKQKLTEANLYFRGAEKAVLYGKGVEYNSYIGSAFTWLNS